MSPFPPGVGGNRSKERDRKSELVLRSTYQNLEWDRNNSARNFYNVVRYVQRIPDVSAKDVSAKTWRRTFRQKNMPKRLRLKNLPKRLA